MNIETKSEFAQILRESLPEGATLQAAEELAAFYANAVHRALAKGATVIRLPNIGAIKASRMAPRKARNPRTGETFETEEKIKLRIVPHTHLRRLVEAKTPSK